MQIQSVDHDDDDWLNDTEEQMQAEDALWEAAYSRHHDHFDALAEAALAEIEAGTTQPMFDEQGEFMQYRKSRTQPEPPPNPPLGPPRVSLF